MSVLAIAAEYAESHDIRSDLIRTEPSDLTPGQGLLGLEVQFLAHGYGIWFVLFR